NSNLKMSHELSQVVISVFETFNEQSIALHNKEKRVKRKLKRKRNLKKKIDKEIQEQLGNNVGYGYRRRGDMARNSRRLDSKDLSDSNTEMDSNEEKKSDEPKLFNKTEEDYISRPVVSLKRLVKYLKIKTPSLIVDKILNKKYPTTKKEFKKKYL